MSFMENVGRVGECLENADRVGSDHRSDPELFKNEATVSDLWSDTTLNKILKLRFNARNGRGSRTRTCAWEDQNLLPYHLAIPLGWWQ